MTEFQANSLIARYLGKKEEFDRHTTEIQASLESCGWQWAAKDIGEYNTDSRYQYWLVSAEMYESLELDLFDGGETPEMLDEPDPKWIENTDYILF